MESGIHLIKSVFMSAAEGIIISDRSGAISAANPKAALMFGYEEGEMEHLKVSDLVPRTVKGHHEALRDKYFHQPVPRPMGIGKDLHGRKKDGNVFPLEISLNHFEQHGHHYVAAFVTDITHRKELERQQKEYLDQLEIMVKERTAELENVNIGLMREVGERKAAERQLRESQKLHGLIAQNFPKGTISILNKDCQYLFSDGEDVPSGEFFGDTLFIQKFPEELQSYITVYLNGALKGVRGSCEYEIKDRHYIMHTVPIQNEGQETDKVLVVEVNITEQKKAEREVRKALDKEKELNELKSRFVSMASHEFRTPLATILSSTNLIAKYGEGENASKISKHVGRIQSNIKNLTEILNDFLSLEKLESGVIGVTLESVDIAQFSQDILEELNALLKKDQSFDFQQTPCVLRTDPKILKNVLLNILSNSIKYSGEGQVIHLRMNLAVKWLLIEVEDHGVGIPKADQSHIFDRFFRAENVSNIQGTGLGLHIVNKYVRLLEGEISFESEENKGTKVTIQLPYEKE